MKLIDRYIGKQLVVTGLFAIAVLSLILVLGNVFKQIFEMLINHDVPIEYIIGFIAYVFPFSLTFTIPWGFLTAVLLVFGKLSAENELLSLRSSGLSIYRMSASLFVLAGICVGICLWMNISVAPRAQLEMRNQVALIATHNPLALFGNDQVIEEFPGKKIYIEKKRGSELFNILVYELNEKNEPVNVIHAKRGQLDIDVPNQQVLMHIWDGRYERRDPNNPSDLTRIQQGITIKETDYSISLQQLFQRNKSKRGIPMMTIEELIKKEGIPQTPAQISAANTELNKRFSFSIAALAFALIGVPFAVTAQRRETSIGFLFSFVIAFTYFFFIIIADTMRKNPHAHPELLIWVPNLIFIPLGAFLFWRLGRK